jgi:hypothetical protein
MDFGQARPAHTPRGQHAREETSLDHRCSRMNSKARSASANLDRQGIPGRPTPGKKRADPVIEIDQGLGRGLDRAGDGPNQQSWSRRPVGGDPPTRPARRDGRVWPGCNHPHRALGLVASRESSNGTVLGNSRLSLMSPVGAGPPACFVQFSSGCVCGRIVWSAVQDRPFRGVPRQTQAGRLHWPGFLPPRQRRCRTTDEILDEDPDPPPWLSRCWPWRSWPRGAVAQAATRVHSEEDRPWTPSPVKAEPGPPIGCRPRTS